MSWGLLQTGRRARAARDSRSAGFTLVELLVVLAIIGLMTGLLLPSLSAARAEGMKAGCMSNLRQLAASFVAYSMSDEQEFTTPVHPQAETSWIWDGEYEYGGNTGLGVFAVEDFQVQNRVLNKFLNSDARNTDFKLYQCPNDSGVQSAPVNFEPYFLQAWTLGKTIYEITGTSFRLNNHIDFVAATNYQKHFYGPYMRPRNRVPSASETVLLEETVAEVAKWNAASYTTPGWHRKNNRFNVAFVDGHVDAILLQGQTDLSANYPAYWVLRGQSWRMDCWPDRRVKDRPR